MKSSEYLRQARALIDQPCEWGGAANPGGRHCTAHAIWRTTDYAEGDGLIEAIARTLGLSPGATGDYAPAVYAWNDHPERTHAEVLAAFDTAISYAEAAEQEFSPSACAPVDSLAGLIAKAHER